MHALYLNESSLSNALISLPRSKGKFTPIIVFLLETFTYCIKQIFYRKKCLKKRPHTCALQHAIRFADLRHLCPGLNTIAKSRVLRFFVRALRILRILRILRFFNDFSLLYFAACVFVRLITSYWLSVAADFTKFATTADFTNFTILAVVCCRAVCDGLRIRVKQTAT